METHYLLNLLFIVCIVAGGHYYMPRGPHMRIIFGLNKGNFSSLPVTINNPQH